MVEGLGMTLTQRGGTSIMRRIECLARVGSVGTGWRRRLTMMLSVDGTRDDEAVAR